ncbi:MAG: cupredoxin domain-containing protein, partial [Actinomycetota bacterium]
MRDPPGGHEGGGDGHRRGRGGRPGPGVGRATGGRRRRGRLRLRAQGRLGGRRGHGQGDQQGPGTPHLHPGRRRPGQRHHRPGVQLRPHGPGRPREVDVGAVDFGFEPNNASVAAGGKVTVTNKGQAPHTLTLDDEPLDTGQIAPGATADLTAPDKPGSYSYRCTVHPAKMRGVLVVLGRDTEDPNADPAAPVAATGGGGGPGGGITAFGLATGV